jgi:hypothetical protein
MVLPQVDSDTRSAALLEAVDNFINTHTAKADRAKRRARIATVLLTASTAMIPVFIVASIDALPFLFGKLIPGVLAAVSALTAALVAVEKPQERWALYRRYQRLAEAERLRYVQRCPAYAGNDRDQVLAEWLATTKSGVHDEWSTLVPKSTDVAQTTQSLSAGR